MITSDRAREQLRRAVEDGERLYRVRITSSPTLRDDHRIDGILTRELASALALVDALIENAYSRPHSSCSVHGFFDGDQRGPGLCPNCYSWGEVESGKS